MLYGITSQEVLVAGPASGAIGSFDFLNGSYNWLGTSLTAAEVTDRTDWLGGSGLQVPASQAAGAQLLYADAKTFIATCQFTIACEIQASAGVEQVIFYCASASLLNYIYIEYWDGTSLLDSDNSTFRNASNGGSTGTLKIAGTRKDAADLAMSTAGATAVTSSGYAQFALPTVGNPFTQFRFGGYSNSTVGAVNIHSIRFYNPVADVDLPSLSI